MPQTITPLGMELNPVTEHIDEPYSEKVQRWFENLDSTVDSFLANAVKTHGDQT